jgi:hypothetical protein
MMKFEIDYFADKSVKSYVAVKNGIQFGPKLVFHDTSNVKSCESEYSGRSYGTNMRWIDFGDRFLDTYFTPCDANDVIHRDALLTWLTVTDGDFKEYKSEHKFDLQKSSSVKPQIIDIEAEESWLKQHKAVEHKSIEPPRYYGEISKAEGGRFGATVTFWESGLVRTVSYWQGNNHILGTRSCFNEEGYLWCEQTFAWDGSYTGNWTNRYFEWDGSKLVLNRAEVFRFWKLFKVVDGKSIKTILDEIGLERYTDSLVDHLIEYQRKDENDEWKRTGPIDTSNFLV